jgi:hypothetical protein
MQLLIVTITLQNSPVASASGWRGIQEHAERTKFLELYLQCTELLYMASLHLSLLELSRGQNTIYNYFGRISVFNIVIYFGKMYKELLWIIILLNV